MARTHSAVPIELGSGRVGLVTVRSDIIEYFNITVPADDSSAIAPTLKTRAAHTRNILNEGLGSTGQDVSVEKHEYYSIPTASKTPKGKLCKIPTELKTPKNLTRYTSLRFPGGASNYAIANWINTKFTGATKPKYFLTPGGRIHPVNVASVSDPNPGNDPDPI